jgi:rhombotail lipoprotein
MTRLDTLRRLVTRASLVAAPLLALGACATGTSAHHRTSVVQYFYPDGRAAADTATVPTLRLPLRVGVAFVPPTAPTDRRADASMAGSETDVPEAERLRLTRQIADHFRQRPFVKSVELIPSSYLMPGGGFDNLDQLRSMFDVDVMVLLAYDQVQFTGEGAASMTYLTLLGAYVVQGEKNDTRTMMDAVVLDVSSRKLLFRAPGTSVVKGTSTPIGLEDARRKDRLRGFELASRDLTANLDSQLTAFRERVREAPDEIKVQRTAEYDRRAAATGAGAVDPLTLLLLGGAAVGGLAAARRRR